jgi:uncharacterized membrane protein
VKHSVSLIRISGYYLLIFTLAKVGFYSLDSMFYFQFQISVHAFQIHPLIYIIPTFLYSVYITLSVSIFQFFNFQLDLKFRITSTAYIGA